MGDRPQGVAGDCNSLAETHAWFDSRVAHHLKINWLADFELPNRFGRFEYCRHFVGKLFEEMI